MKRNDKFYNWMDLHWSKLEMEWLNKEVAPEDQPLDDDGPDFMQNNAEVFENWCFKKYKEELK